MPPPTPFTNFAAGVKVPAKQKIDGGPSVLYDAVALLVSDKGAALLAGDAPTKDFISDAFTHCKFIGVSEQAKALLEMAGVLGKADDGSCPSPANVMPQNS